MRTESDFSKRRWITLIATVPIGISLGSFYAWSVFSVPLSEELDISVAAVTTAFTLSSGFSSVMNIVGGALYDRYGTRLVLSLGGLIFAGGYVLTGFSHSLIWLLISFGIILGFGLGISYCTFSVNTANAFPDKRGMATGIVVAGYGSGSFIFAPLGHFLINNFGVLNAFKILGLIVFIVMAVMAQLVDRPPAGFKPAGWQPGKTNRSIVQTNVDKDWKEMLKDPLYYLIFGMLVFTTTSGLMIMGHGSAIAQSISGVTPKTAAWIVGLVSIGNACGRFMMPTASDRLGRSNALMLGFFMSSLAMVTLTQVGHGQVSYLVAVLVIIGFCYGGNMGIFASITTDSFGTKNSGTNFGVVFIGSVFGSTIGPTLGSLVESATGGYTFAFLTAASFSIIGVIFAILAGKTIRKRNQGS